MRRWLAVLRILIGLLGAKSAGRVWGADQLLARVFWPRLVFFPYRRQSRAESIKRAARV